MKSRFRRPRARHRTSPSPPALCRWKVGLTTSKQKTLARRIAAEVLAMYRNACRRGRIVPRVDSVSVCHRFVSTSSARPPVRFVAARSCQTRYHRREFGGVFLGGHVCPARPEPSCRPCAACRHPVSPLQGFWALVRPDTGALRHRLRLLRPAGPRCSTAVSEPGASKPVCGWPMFRRLYF